LSRWYGCQIKKQAFFADISGKSLVHPLKYPDAEQ
jgi:hypothetical protein